MQKPSAVARAAGAARILSVSPVRDDHESLENLVSSRQWTIVRAFTLDHATQFVERDSFSVVVCERDLVPGSWRDLFRDIVSLSSPPFLIVTSRHADDYLWSEALNLGAYNVLAKPFLSAEVIQTLSMAVFHRQYQTDLARIRVRRAVG